MRNERPFKSPRPAVEGGLGYRLYFFESTAHTTKSHEFLAADDRAAIKVAETWREGRTMELWQRARKVKRWDP